MFVYTSSMAVSLSQNRNVFTSSSSSTTALAALTRSSRHRVQQHLPHTESIVPLSGQGWWCASMRLQLCLPCLNVSRGISAPGWRELIREHACALHREFGRPPPLLLPLKWRDDLRHLIIGLNRCDVFVAAVDVWRTGVRHDGCGLASRLLTWRCEPFFRQHGAVAEPCLRRKSAA